MIHFISYSVTLTLLHRGLLSSNILQAEKGDELVAFRCEFSVGRKSNRVKARFTLNKWINILQLQSETHVITGLQPTPLRLFGFSLNKIINHKTACVDSLNVKNNFSCPPPPQHQHRWIKKELKMKEFWQLSAKLCCKLTAIPARVSEVSVAFTPLLFLLIQMIYWPGGSVGENIMLNNAVRRLLNLPSVHEHLE